MKQIISLALAAALLTATLCACGDSNSRTSTVPSDSAGESASVPPARTSSGELPEQPGNEASAGPGRVNLAAFAQTLQENHEFPTLDRLDPADEFDAVMLENSYPGLKDMDLEQIEVYLASSFSGVELALVQAKNAGDAARVKEIFDARVAARTAEDSKDYPDAGKLWQRCSAVASGGNYVMLVAHEDSNAIVSEFNALFQ